jgi:type I restriction enzyme S subunit
MVTYIRNRAVGSAVPGINLGILKSLPVPLPSLWTQQRIASILSAYDDLIQNNTRRIQILEKMAQAIYREWFVEFRFPGHEGVRMVDSELGLIPEGWAVVPASTALEIDPRLKPDPASVRPFAPMTSLSESTMHIEPIEQRKGSAGSKFENGDTLFARITPCLENGKTAFVQALAPGEIASGSTEFIVLRSRLLTAEFVYLLARSEPFRAHAIKSMSGATGRQRVRVTCFDSYLLALPPTSILSRFQQIVAPMFALSYALFRANQKLRHTRDLLLPRVISGEIDVSNLDLGSAEPAA